MGYTTNQSSSIGDLPDNVVDVVKGLVKGGFIDPDAAYEDLPDIPDGMTDALQSGEHVTHEGLIDMAHQEGLAMIYTEPVQIPDPEKRKPVTETYEDGNGNKKTRQIAEGPPVIFRATVVTRRGVFTQYGDAHENDTMVDAIERMAETRAINRALRSAVNVGAATAAEMPGSTDGVQID